MVNYDKFINLVYSEFKDIFNKDDIKEILNIEDLFDKDNPKTSCKRLMINRLKLKGVKKDNTKINYDKIFEGGVNLLIADNSKGKSSTYKIIKFLLTGKDNHLKPDVKTWIKQVALEFALDNNIYTICLDKPNSKVKGALFKLPIKNLINKDDNLITSLSNDQILFKFKSREELKNRMESFFFNELSYYSLKWTEPSSSKIGISSPGTRWNTYFKTIYLESKDYTHLFIDTNIGAQDKKLFEMLLGLRYTAAINKLFVLLKTIEAENKLLEVTRKELSENNSKNSACLSEELSLIKNKIKIFRQNTNFTYNFNIVNEYNTTLKSVNVNDLKISGLSKQKFALDKEINKTKKYINNIKENLEFGRYFSTLEVKNCPRCGNLIDQSKKELEQYEHSCMICDSHLTTSEDTKVLEDKLKKYEDSLQKLEDSHMLLCSEITSYEKNTEELNFKLSVLEEQLETMNNKISVKDYDILLEKKGELEARLNLINNNSYATDKPDEYIISKSKFQVIKYALNKLTTMRFEESKDLLKKFSTLIEKELHDFGQKNITDVNIDEKLNISFIQNDLKSNFNELNEGEKLRFKIAFYLSLIESDIIYNLGRHPRFLIIDSPGKEEVIEKDLAGLSSIFKKIDERLHDKLQIFVGTALREFETTVNEKQLDIKAEGEYVF
ncbi:hypothetical protein AL714_09275 [Clostridium botulinum]|uniref:hypothetical protein n=1 Tax=Clostridium botulinum TaxID=1491 RepID=UPI00099D5F81|nr:hypothetical protein [Clostridium botulinum]OPD37324.1 hypothetical protein AL714_09275 [Clostridium botulinum]